ncbi:hypothetical protein ACFYXM_09010 [Streptomyces sp. NPDC002476]|uniref:hypothetical protein n=1 Tax=Streptomyces sp. NPDC002476 TaxID=3364648 RepID=UPI0036D02839
MSVPMTPDRMVEIREAAHTYNEHPTLGFACCSAHDAADAVPELLAEVDRLRKEVAWYHGELTGANLTAWETEQENGLLRTALESAGREPQWAARLRLAWESARRGRRDVQLRCELAEEDYRRVVRGACQVESQLRARVAELASQRDDLLVEAATAPDTDDLAQQRNHYRDEAVILRARVTELEAAQSTAVADRDAQIIAWLGKKSREYRSTGSRQHALQADVIEVLASKISRGAVRGTETASPWERAVAGLNALVDAGVDFHVEPDGHISAPFSEEHIEWDLKAKRWVLTHDEHDGGSDA